MKTTHIEWMAVCGCGGRWILTMVVGALLSLPISFSAEAQNLLWARRAGSAAVMSTGNDLGQAIAVDRFGNSYVTGQFRETATFGPGQPNQTILVAGATQQIFVAKYDLNGFLQWANRLSTFQGEGNAMRV